MNTHTLLCFGARPGAGNPALVIEHGAADIDSRQAFARARGATCVFIDDAGGEPRVDFYYPHLRSPLCVHATLAVAAVLFARGPSSETIAVRTAVQGQRLDLVREDDAYFVRLQRQPAPAPDVAADAVAALLHVRSDALVGMPVGRPAVASVGSPKLLVQVRDADTLHGLAPDLNAIAAWGRAQGVNGLYAYHRLDDGTYEGRNFNHLEPTLEDSATGVAAGALTALLGHGIVLRQGRATGKDCLIRTRVEGEAILVGGRVELA
jgi:PhzF family phenazine biosynthesis protein